MLFVQLSTWNGVYCTERFRIKSLSFVKQIITHLAGAELERCGGGECNDIDVIESLELGRLLLVVACTTAGAVPAEIGGGLFG